jgi:hypothetical protein
MRTTITTAVIALILGAVAGFSLRKPQIVTKTKEIIKYKKQQRIVTRIVERPNGEKVTIIDSRTQEASVSDKRSSQKVVRGAGYILSLSATPLLKNGTKPIYGVGLQKRLLGGLSGGLYVRSNKEVGILISYSF